MKIRNDHFKNTSDFEGRKGSATLNMNRLSLFMDNMISNYNFPELAVLREWVSNADDAHVAAGVDRRVLVTLPTRLNPTLIVQDFGLGMTPDFVENVYLDFGSSSKDASNDEIGGFGIGGKSALAIASQYTMTTISGGFKSVYIFERSPKGGVDFKNPIYNVPTDEESGTVVQVAVDRVEEYSEVNLNRVLAGWSNSRVELSSGKEFFSIPDSGTLVNFDLDLTDLSKVDQPDFEEDIRKEKGYVLHGAFDLTGESKKLSTSLKLNWNEHVVLVGPVAYIFQPDLQTNRVLNDYMVASVNIGDVSFPSSREVIEPTRNNRTFVGKCFEKIVDEADKLIQKKADTIKDRGAALSLHRSPLAQNRRDFKINFRGEAIPKEFKPKTGESIFQYEQTGGWRGVKGYKLAEQHIHDASSFKLDIQTLVVQDDESSLQSIRNNVRLVHASEDAKPSDLAGYLVISSNPNLWVKAAAKKVVKSSVLAQEARDYRKKIRDEAAAAAASGNPLVSTAPVRKTRKDRIGEYGAHWLSFGKDEKGNAAVAHESSDLMDFYTNHFDPKKTLVLSTNNSDYSPESFAKHFAQFSINPKDAQFLRVNTGAQLATLRILLGEDVVISELEDWLKENFSKLASFHGRTPKEIAKDLPVEIDSSVHALIKEMGVENLHPKYAEILEAQKELDEAQELLGAGYYYGDGSTRLVRKLLSGFSDVKIKDRPEFFFLAQMGYYRQGKLSKSEMSSIKAIMNQMVEHWLDNLALEEAEAEDASAEADAKNTDSVKSLSSAN